MKVFTLFFVLAVVVAFGAACSSSGGGDAATALQGRKDYVYQKYRNPQSGRIPDDVRAMEMAFAQSMPGAHDKETEGLLNGTFSSIGPWNVGGRTRAFVLDVRNENTIVAAGVSGGIWRSTDAGATWTKATKPTDIHAITSIAQDPRPGNYDTWYAVTGEAWGNSAQISGNGVWKSTDGGRNWQPLPSTVSPLSNASGAFAYAWRVVVHPTSGDVYVATSGNGIQRSTDGGATWRSVLGSANFWADVAITPSGILYAGLSSFTTTGSPSTVYGVFRSQDGQTWTNISPDDLPRNLNRVVLGLVPSDENQLYVIAETPNAGTKGLFRLRDRTVEEWHSLWKYTFRSGGGGGEGGEWSNRSANIPLFGGRSGDFISQGGYDLIVHVSPLDPNFVVIGGTNLYRSTDGFTSTTRTQWTGGYGFPSPAELFPLYPNHHPDQHNFAYLPSDPTKAYSIHDGGISFTDDLLADTVRWTSRNNGYVTTQFYAIAAPDIAGDTRVAGGTQDNGTYMTSASTERDIWVRRLGGDGSYCAFADSGRVLVASSQNARIRRIVFNNQGQEVGRGRIDPIGGRGYLFINPFALDPNNGNVMYLAGGTMLWRNRNLSEIPLGTDDSTAVNWDSLPGTRQVNAQISAIGVSTTPANIVYFGTTAGRVFRIANGLAQTIEPVNVTGTGFVSGGFVSSIAVDPRNSQHVLVAFSNYGVESVFATSDGGSTWQNISGNLEVQTPQGRSGPAVNSVAILPRGDSALYVAGTSAGLYYTVQLNGNSTVWNHASADLIGVVPVDMVLARRADSLLIVGTHGRGIFTGRITSSNPPPQAPVAALPGMLARGIYPDTTLSWQPVPDAVSYTAELSNTADFSDSLVRFEGLRETRVNVRGLVQGPRQYFWRVFAFGPGGRSLPSAPSTFFTAIRPPQLLAPIGGTPDTKGDPVTLRWERVEGATSYDVQVSLNPGFTDALSERNGVTDTTTSINLTTSNRRHFWRVRSADADTAGVFAQRQNFITGIITSVASADEALGLELSPNPATSTLSIQLEGGLGATMDVMIADATGREVVRHGSLPTKASVSVVDLAAGSYTLSVRCGARRWSRPLTIVR
jgi:photosystem II stability/assembly factor-like uncharacterized protein